MSTLREALLDRRDITDEREGRNQRMTLTDTTNMEHYLREIRDILGPASPPVGGVDENIDIIVTDQEVAELIMRNFPMKGMSRWVVRRTGNGFSAFAVTVAFQLLLPANENRLGLRVRNSGAANGVTLILSKDLAADGAPLLAGAPSIWLPPNGDWDGKIGDLLWGGSISVGGATSTVTVAEV